MPSEASSRDQRAASRNALPPRSRIESLRLVKTACWQELERAARERGTREHFSSVNAEVLSLDWLELHPEGHRRALFSAGGPQWVQP